MIKNKKTGQMYIGQSKNIERRFREHCNIISVDKAILLQGEDNFDFIIIEEVDESLLREREKYWIEYYNTEQDTNHYNKIQNHGIKNLKNGYGHDNGKAKYTLWDITCSNYQRTRMTRNNRPLNPCRCFSFRYKGEHIPIGAFHDFVSCEIINQLVEEAIKDEVK